MNRIVEHEPARHRLLVPRRQRADGPRRATERLAGVDAVTAYLALGAALTYGAFSAGAMAGLWLWSVAP